MDLGPPISDKKIKEAKEIFGPYHSVQKMVRLRQLFDLFWQAGKKFRDEKTGKRWLDTMDDDIYYHLRLLAGQLPMGLREWEEKVVQRYLVLRNMANGLQRRYWGSDRIMPAWDRNVVAGQYRYMRAYVSGNSAKDIIDTLNDYPAWVRLVNSRMKVILNPPNNQSIWGLTERPDPFKDDWIGARGVQSERQLGPDRDGLEEEMTREYHQKVRDKMMEEG